MATLREWLDRFTKHTGEKPYAVVMTLAHREWEAEKWPALPDGVVSFAEVSDDVLNHRFNDESGGNESPDLCAWSTSWVIFSDNYDGSEELCWVPRNPVTHTPIRPGGG